MAKNGYTSGSGKKLTNVVLVRLDDETKADLKKLADDLGYTPTSVARMLIQFGLTRQEEFKEKVTL